MSGQMAEESPICAWPDGSKTGSCELAQSLRRAATSDSWGAWAKRVARIMHLGGAVKVVLLSTRSFNSTHTHTLFV